MRKINEIIISFFCIAIITAFLPTSILWQNIAVKSDIKTLIDYTPINSYTIK